jgi:hypothetical protein
MSSSESSENPAEAGVRATRPDGPVETGPWPTTLEARVVTPGDEPRIHGYDVESDLAVHYSFVETTLLTLTGELPSAAQAEAFSVALEFLAPLSVAHAPTHAAVLARICGARFSSIAAIAAVTLAERARAILDEHSNVLDWLDGMNGGATAPPPESSRARSEGERASVSRLRRSLSTRGITIPALATEHELGRMPALLAALHFSFSGLKHREQVEAALVLGGFTSAVAEARTREVASFREYPMNVPRFVYEESDG